MFVGGIKSGSQRKVSVGDRHEVKMSSHHAARGMKESSREGSITQIIQERLRHWKCSVCSAGLS